MGMVILALAMLLSVPCAALPSPAIVRGYVLESDATTQAPSGTPFSINDTSSGTFVSGVTGRGPSNPGKYAAIVSGYDGDTIIVRGWNQTHQGTLTTTLASSMYNVNVALNESLPNTPPLITSTPDNSTEEDSAFGYAVVVDDYLDTIRYLLMDGPGGMVLNNETGLLSWAPDNDDVGAHEVSLLVNDSFGALAWQNFTLNVTPTNDAPGFSSTPNTSATQDTEYSYQALATDPDNLNGAGYDDDILTYSLASAPAGMGINATTGIVAWVPDNDDVGGNAVIVRASDGEAEALQSFSISVANVNDPPAFSSAPVGVGYAGALYSYSALADDPDDEPLDYALATAPSGMAINATSGLITWFAYPEDAGNHSVTVQVSDGEYTDLQAFTLGVEVSDDAPSFTSAAVAEGTEGELYSYTAEATDPNGDSLTFSLFSGPDGMSVGTAGSVMWMPAEGEEGEHAVVLSVSDGTYSAFQSYIISVANQNSPPAITSTPPSSALEDSTLSYAVTASDADGDGIGFLLAVAPADMTLNNSTGLLAWTPDNDDVGNHTVMVIVNDSVLVTNQSFNLSVNGTNDAPVFLSTPATTATESAYYSYQVVATDPDNSNTASSDDDTLSYSLSSAPAGMAIAGGLAEWVPTAVQVGSQHAIIGVSDGETTTYQQFTITVSALERNGGGSVKEEVVEEFFGNVALKAAIDFINRNLPTPIAITDEEIAITEVTLTVTDDITDASLEVERLAKKPSAIREIPGDGRIFQYLSIGKAGMRDEQITLATITFRVAREWIEKYGKSAEDVVLHRYHGSEWQELTTRAVADDGKIVTFEAESSGFSYFAITFREERGSRPTIDPGAEIIAKSMFVPFHMKGAFLMRDNVTQVPYGTPFTIRNINTSFVVTGRTGGGPESGSFSVLVEGRRGNHLLVLLEGWSVMIILEGDSSYRFVTSLQPKIELFSPEGRQGALSMIIGLAVALLVFSVLIFHHISIRSLRRELKQRNGKTSTLDEIRSIRKRLKRMG